MATAQPAQELGLEFEGMRNEGICDATLQIG